jgi:hypothetical protein
VTSLMLNKIPSSDGNSRTPPEIHEGPPNLAESNAYIVCMCLVVVRKTPSRPCVTSFITNDNSNDVCIIK